MTANWVVCGLFCPVSGRACLLLYRKQALPTSLELHYNYAT
jgi:hypothetical protein